MFPALPLDFYFGAMPAIAGERHGSPETKYLAPDPQLGQPHHVMLNLHCSVLP
jgi:hypothetical protein